MSNRFAIPSGSSPFVFANVSRSLRSSDLSASARPLLVSDSGDDYEMSDEFAKTWLRASDRLIGFLLGGAVLAAAWAAWTVWSLV
jgi:hypothetical protein